MLFRSSQKISISECRLGSSRPARVSVEAVVIAAVAALDRGDLEALAAAGACAALIGNRHRAFWEVAGTEISLPLAPPAPETAVPLLSRPTEGEDLVADYRSVGLTLGRHPLALLWPALARSSDELSSARELAMHADGAPVRVAGIVVTRQKPSTASGVTFVTLEDHTGNVNLIVWKKIGETQRRTLFGARLMEVEGRLQREQGVTHVIVTRLHDRTPLLGRLLTRSRDFR